MKQSSFMQIKTRLILLLLASVLLIPSVSAASGKEEDREKPKPEFTKNNDIITAKLIPRAKSSSITIDFQVAGGGVLASVQPFDINKALNPQINVKDFRSDLFALEMTGIAPGGDLTLNVSSAFFTSSTYFWIFNEKLPTPWMDSKAENLAMGEKVQKFIIQIKDGGPFDSDGAANGKITIIGGPVDSFWGYVLGTLFIRFFGVFIVLGVLMIGMMFSGQVFQWAEKQNQRPEPVPVTDFTPQPPTVIYDEPQAPRPSAVPLEMAAAIGVALSLCMAPPKLQPTATDATRPAPSWAMDGRRQIMADRSMVFNRRKG